MLYPLIIEALGGRLLTIGAEYYNTVFSWLMVPLLILCSASVTMVWGGSPSTKRIKRYAFIALGAIILTMLSCWWTEHLTWLYAAGLFGGWVILLSTFSAWLTMRKRQAPNGSVITMLLGHSALGLFALSATFNGALTYHNEFVLREGEVKQSDKVRVELADITHSHGANYLSRYGELRVDNGEHTFTLAPEQRYYPVADQFTTEADLKYFFTFDAYATIRQSNLTDDMTDTPPSFLVQYRSNVAISWLWLSIAFGGLSGFMALRSQQGKA